MVQASAARRRWGMPHAAIIPDTASDPNHVEPASPLRTQRKEFFIGDTVGFADKVGLLKPKTRMIGGYPK
jgi:hypothetical protein